MKKISVFIAVILMVLMLVLPRDIYAQNLGNPGAEKFLSALLMI